MTTEREIGDDRLGPAGDDFYEALSAAHEGLDFGESAALNARLVLILANLVAEPDLLNAALRAAAIPNPQRISD